MAAHNGGLGQLEFDPLNAWMDLMRCAELANYNLDLNAIDRYGLPKAYTRAKCCFYAVPVPYHRAAVPIVKLWYDGVCDFTIGNASVQSSGNTGGVNWKIIKANGSSPRFTMDLKSLSVAPTYIHCTYIDDEAAFLGGEYLQPAVVADLAYLKPGRMRFMNAASASGCALVTAEQMTRETDLIWSGLTRFGDYTGKVATAVKDPNTAVDEYDLTCPGYVETHGAIVYLQVNAALTSTTIGSSTYHAMKISINGGPRKDVGPHNTQGTYIYDVHKLRALPGSNPPQYAYASFRYDAVFDRYVIMGGGSEAPWGGGAYTHVPYSMQAKIATRFGCDIHTTLFGGAGYPLGTAIQSACDEVEANLGPGLKAVIEFSNEVWNTARGYFTTIRATDIQFLKKANRDPNQGYGRFLASIAPTVHAAFGGNKARYQLVSAIGTAPTPVSATTGTPRISAQDAVSEGLPSPRPYIDEMQMTSYFQSEIYPPGVNPSKTNSRWVEFLYWAKKWQDAVANNEPVWKAKALRAMTDGCLRPPRDNQGASQVSQFNQVSTKGAAIQSAYPGMKVGFYEGGYSTNTYGAEPTITVTGVDPEGNTVTYNGLQPTGTKKMCNDFAARSRYDDPKMAWVAFQWYHKLSIQPGFRYPSRYGYGPSGVFGNWEVANGNGISPKDQDAEGFAAFSNGDGIMLMEGV